MLLLIYKAIFRLKQTNEIQSVAAVILMLII